MRRKTNADKIRTVLRDSEGLTASNLAERLDACPDLIRTVLNQMPDAYIARWDRSARGHGFVAIWRVPDVPPNAPRPLAVPKERKVYDAEYREKRKAKVKTAKAAKPVPNVAPAEPTSPAPKTRWVTPPPWAN